MNLVKWFRKNNKKVMAVVVVILMIGFVGGTYISHLTYSRRIGRNQVVAHFADNRKITNEDLNLAQRELTILKMVQADTMLRSQGLQEVMLGELLFFERRISSQLNIQIKQSIRVNDFRVSEKQIDDIYAGTAPYYVYWLLLRNEAQLAGIRISNQTAGSMLGMVIPRLFDGATYSQLMNSLIKQRGVPEKEMLTTFGKLLAVLEYARMLCSNEDITTSQIEHNLSWENETIDTEFVKFDSSVFAETQAEPAEEQIVEQFDRYKHFFAGEVSRENAYGFGYKLPDRVGLEYIVVKIDDVKAIVTPPTQQEIQQYYQKHREQFIEQVPSEANDPNSPPTERIRSYAEMANIISNGLLRDKINTTADRILQEAKTLTEVALEDMDTELENLTTEQFKQIAGDYKTTTDQLAEKHQIKVYAGKTGLLSAIDMRTDQYLAGLCMKGYGYSLRGLPNIVLLSRIVFAIDELQAAKLGPFDVPKPRMYENIGPVRDIAGQIMALVRVVKAEKAVEPESINQTFSKSSLNLGTTPEQTGGDVYSIREKVVDDLKKLAAMDTVKRKAEQFKDLAAKDGWDSALDKFNELYAQQDKQEQADPNDKADPNVSTTPDEIKAVSGPFKMDSLQNRSRISSMLLKTRAVQSVGDPAAQLLVNEVKKHRMLNDQLYSLVPQDSNTVEKLPLILEFKPEMSYYCLKKIHVRRFRQDEYEKAKAMQVYKEDVIQSQSMTAVHFNPENILKRMNFKWVPEQAHSVDANAAAEANRVQQ